MELFSLENGEMFSYQQEGRWERGQPRKWQKCAYSIDTETKEQQIVRAKTKWMWYTKPEELTEIVVRALYYLSYLRRDFVHDIWYTLHLLTIRNIKEGTFQCWSPNQKAFTR